MSESSLTRRVALGALGATVVGAAITAAYRARPLTQTGGGAVGQTPKTPLSMQVEDALKAAVRSGRPAKAQVDRPPLTIEPAPVSDAAPESTRSVAARQPAPHPDDPQRRPDTLANRAILSGGAHRSVLYTWTTTEQIEALRAGGRLLHRTHSPKHGESRFDQTLKAHPRDGLSSWLLKAQNRFRRFAWPYPWATLMGWPDENYGTQLLRIELAPCMTARLRTLAVERMNSTRNRPESIHNAWSNHQPRQRVGAVYHEHDTQYSPPQNSFMPWGSQLREYVLFSERHVARFSHGDPACLAAIRADIDLLEQVKANLDRFAADTTESGFPKQVRTAADEWAANLALCNGSYTPRASVINVILGRLRAAAAAQGPAFARR